MNKRISFTFYILVFLAITARSQQIIHFPISHGVWHETYVLSPPPMLFSYDAIGEIYYNGDTIINNISYHKLFRTFRDIFCSHVINSNFYCANLREDTLLNKVYVKEIMDNSEYVLYDFNLQPGDTIPNSGAVVDFIDTITTSDGIKRRRWNAIPAYFGAGIIEGIGSTNGLLTNTLFREYPDVTLCFEGDNQQTVSIVPPYGYGNEDCRVETDTCYYLHAEDLFEKSLTLFPNPIKSNDYLHVLIQPSHVKELITIEVVDVEGNMLSSNKNNIIQVPSCEGYYFIVIKRELKTDIVRKIIVTNSE